jgi:hypothetical protein
MALVTVAQVKSLLEPTKLQHPANLDTDLLGLIEPMVLGRLAPGYDTSTWISNATTPKIVQTIISMIYAAYYYDKVYSEDVTTKESPWVQRLLANAEMLIAGITDGSITLVEIGDSTIQQPIFYPNDNSSLQNPSDNNYADTSLGNSKFSMGTVF